MPTRCESGGKVTLFFTRKNDDLRTTMWHKGVERRIHELGWDARLNQRGELSEDDLSDELQGVDALITTWETPKLTERTLSRANSLRIVGHAAGSVAFIATDAIWDRNIAVTTANSLIAERVAAYNVMMTLFGLRKVMEYANCGDTDRWELAPNRKRIRGPSDAIIGIWGYGDVAKYLISFLKFSNPLEFLVCDEYLCEDEARRLKVRKVNISQLFEQSDVLHLLQSLTPATIGQIGQNELASLKDGAVLINSARAHLVDNDALRHELRTGRFYAILDVLPEEPLPKSDTLRTMRNVFFTPHTAGAGIEHLLVPFILEEFERFFQGKRLEHNVSRERAIHMTQLVPEKAGGEL